MSRPQPSVPLPIRLAFVLSIVIMCLLFFAFLGILIARSVPIDEGQEWSALATAGLLRGAV